LQQYICLEKLLVKPRIQEEEEEEVVMLQEDADKLQNPVYFWLNST
jgi:hypothetical protein